MSSAETATADTAEDPAGGVDEHRRGLLATFQAELGEAVAGSHLRAGEDVWVRVTRDAWREAGRIARDALGCTYFCFLSAIDWLPSPYGKDEDSQEDLAVTGVTPKAAAEMRTGLAGGDTRFQVFARVVRPHSSIGVILKADLEEPLSVASWVPNYAGADWHERETWEMYGIEFVGHPHLRHLYLPGEFEGHPLRKDFPLLARRVKPWPGIVDVEPMPGEDAPAEGEVPAGDMPVPDAAEAPRAEDLAPAEPPAEAPPTGDADKKPAAEAPVPAHGEMASQEQLDEGERAVDMAGGGGVDTTGVPTGEADTGRPGQGGTGQEPTDTAKTPVEPGRQQPAPGEPGEREP